MGTAEAKGMQTNSTKRRKWRRTRDTQNTITIRNREIHKQRHAGDTQTQLRIRRREGGSPCINIRIQVKFRMPKGLVCITVYSEERAAGRAKGGNKYYIASYGTAKTAPPEKMQREVRPPTRKPNSASATYCPHGSVHRGRVRRQRGRTDFTTTRQRAAGPMAARCQRLRAYLTPQFAHGDHRAAAPTLPTTQQTTRRRDETETVEPHEL